MNPYFSGLSTLTMSTPVSSSSSTSITMTLYPLIGEGLILYCSQAGHIGDFISLGLVRQKLVLSINLGE